MHLHVITINSPFPSSLPPFPLLSPSLPILLLVTLFSLPSLPSPLSLLLLLSTHAVSCLVPTIPHQRRHRDRWTSGSLEPQRISWNNSLHFSCHRGFFLLGPQVATCTINGTWTELPSCKGATPTHTQSHTPSHTTHIHTHTHTHTHSLPHHPPLCEGSLYSTRPRPLSALCLLPPLQWIAPSTQQGQKEVPGYVDHHDVRSLPPLPSLPPSTSPSFHLSLLLPFFHSSLPLSFQFLSFPPTLLPSLSLSPAPPVIHPVARTIIFNLGDTIVVHCQAWGHPKPNVSWYQEGEEVGEDGRVQQDNGSLVITNATFADEGEFQCSATNTAGEDIVNITLFTATEREKLPLPLLPPYPYSPPHPSLTAVAFSSLPPLLPLSPSSLHLFTLLPISPSSLPSSSSSLRTTRASHHH